MISFSYPLFPKIQRRFISSLLICTVVILSGCGETSEAPTNQAAKQQEAVHGSINNALGVQLWTFRNEMTSDIAGTLKNVRDLGFTYVEAHDATYLREAPEAFRAYADEAGLDVVALHWNDLREWREEPELIMEVARTIGAEHVGIAWLKEVFEDPVTEGGVIQAADMLMDNCSIAKENGLGLYYHIHGYEFQPTGEGDKTYFDSFMERIDPGCVRLQLDIFWGVYAGLDPLDLFEKYGDAIDMLHVKNMASDVETGTFSGANFSPPDMPPEYWVPLGEGKIDFKPILQTAQTHQVKWYFLEMDHAGHVFDDVRTSLEYLEREGFLHNWFPVDQ